MKKFLVFFLFSSYSVLLFGQYSETIATARPGAANGAGTVGKGVLQFQTGIQYDEVRDVRDSMNYRVENTSENLVIRFGLRERFEVSTVINHINSMEFLEDGSESLSRSGINTSLIRARTTINDHLALQVGVSTRIRSEDYKIDFLAPRFRVMYSTPFGEYAGLTTNIGTYWNGLDGRPRGFYVFSFSFALTDNMSLIAESYGNFIKSQINNYFDIGLGYNLNKDLLIDLNGGWGANYPYKSYFLTAGISYRIITRFRPEDMIPNEE